MTNPGSEVTAGAGVVTRTNLCTNPRGVFNFPEYTPGGTTAITPNVAVATHPDGVTTANRVTYAAGANPGVTLVNPLVSGSTYAITAWVFHESIAPTPGSQGLAQAGVVSQPGAPAVVAGAWQKLSWVVTAAGTSQLGYRISGQAGGSGSFLITGVICELNAAGAIQSAAPLFFDGATAAAGDYTYAWNGGANASTSYQRGVSVTGLGGSCPGVQSGEWAASGTKSARVHATAPTSDSYTSPGGDTGGLRLGMEPGKVYTVMGKVRLDAVLAGSAQPSRALSLVAFTRVGTGSYVETRSTSAANAVGVTAMALTFTVPAGATEAFIRVYNGYTQGAGSVWWDDLMLVEGAYSGDYLDGSKAMARWDAAANASTSVGYPPGLYELAGKPDLDLGVVQSSGGVAIPVAAFGARSLYLCYEATANGANYPNFGTYGVASTKGVTFQTGPSGGSTLFPRMDFPGGSSNVGVTLVGGRALARRHVVSMIFPAGLASVRSAINGGAERVDALTPGATGWDDGRAATSGGSDGRGLRLLAYYAEHSDATRLAITRYLGNKYGALTS